MSLHKRQAVTTLMDKIESLALEKHEIEYRNKSNFLF